MNETEINEGRYVKNFNDALDVMDKIMRDKSDEPLTPRDMAKLKAAQTIITSYPRMVQARASTVDTALKVFDAAAENKEQYREFVKSHLPRVAPLLAMPEIINHRDNPIDSEERYKKLSSDFANERQKWNDEKAELLFKIGNLEKNG